MFKERKSSDQNARIILCVGALVICLRAGAVHAGVCWFVVSLGDRSTNRQNAEFKIKVTYQPPGGVQDSFEATATITPLLPVPDALVKVEAAIRTGIVGKGWGDDLGVCPVERSAIGRPIGKEFTIRDKRGQRDKLRLELTQDVPGMVTSVGDPGPEECACAPAISLWGLLLLSLLLLAGMGIKFGRRRAVAA